MFNLQNIRFGHACNSSSYHSLIVFPKDHKRPSKDSHAADHEYDHGRFTLTTAAAKWGYIGALLAMAVEDLNLPQYLLTYYVDNWLQGHALEGYVDHQSCIPIPRVFNTNLPHKEFFDELTKTLMDKQLVIFGGSDECFEDSLVNKYVKQSEYDSLCSPLMGLRDTHYEYARQDPKYGYWVLYSPKTGAKLRFDFQNRLITKSSLPELVDLNITDYCNRACPYCYKSSGLNGRHADYEDICQLIDALSQLQVFEIAIGGGEPTLHPRFIDILRYCRQQGIVPSFTTKNYEWFHNDTNVAVFKECCGRVAFSIRDWVRKDVKEISTLIFDVPCIALPLQMVRKDVKEISTLIHYHNLRDRVTIQCIDGITNICDDLLNSEIPITILGYKDTGRLDAQFNPKRHTPVSNLYDRIYSFGCDTTYFKQYAKEIKKAYNKYWENANLPAADAQVILDSLCTAQEGVYSMYIDAVKHRMAPSSFSEESKVILNNVPKKTFNEIADWCKQKCPSRAQIYGYQIQAYFTEVSERESQK
jgi:pyruvate-formate lyase-activating enzyme